ncbi:MAG: hypothetical protein LBB63_03050 [Holosporaceae bacterium]|jgi:hypothetical protein|nr:hypothetical protein [Holosporaceae bacterium]
MKKIFMCQFVCGLLCCECNNVAATVVDVGKYKSALQNLSPFVGGKVPSLIAGYISQLDDIDKKWRTGVPNLKGQAKTTFSSLVPEIEAFLRECQTAPQPPRNNGGNRPQPVMNAVANNVVNSVPGRLAPAQLYTQQNNRRSDGLSTDLKTFMTDGDMPLYYNEANMVDTYAEKLKDSAFALAGDSKYSCFCQGDMATAWANVATREGVLELKWWLGHRINGMLIKAADWDDNYVSVEVAYNFERIPTWLFDVFKVNFEGNYETMAQSIVNVLAGNEGRKNERLKFLCFDNANIGGIALSDIRTAVRANIADDVNYAKLRFALYCKYKDVGANTLLGKLLAPSPSPLTEVNGAVKKKFIDSISVCNVADLSVISTKELVPLGIDKKIVCWLDALAQVYAANQASAEKMKNSPWFLECLVNGTLPKLESTNKKCDGVGYIQCLGTKYAGLYTYGDVASVRESNRRARELIAKWIVKLAGVDRQVADTSDDFKELWRLISPALVYNRDLEYPKEAFALLAAGLSDWKGTNSLSNMLATAYARLVGDDRGFGCGAYDRSALRFCMCSLEYIYDQYAVLEEEDDKKTAREKVAFVLGELIQGLNHCPAGVNAGVEKGFVSIKSLKFLPFDTLSVDDLCCSFFAESYASLFDDMFRFYVPKDRDRRGGLVRMVGAVRVPVLNLAAGATADSVIEEYGEETMGISYLRGTLFSGLYGFNEDARGLPAGGFGSGYAYAIRDGLLLHIAKTLSGTNGNPTAMNPRQKLMYDVYTAVASRDSYLALYALTGDGAYAADWRVSDWLHEESEVPTRPRRYSYGLDHDVLCLAGPDAVYTYRTENSDPNGSTTYLRGMTGDEYDLMCRAMMKEAIKYGLADFFRKPAGIPYVSKEWNFMNSFDPTYGAVAKINVTCALGLFLGVEKGFITIAR